MIAVVDLVEKCSGFQKKCTVESLSAGIELFQTLHLGCSFRHGLVVLQLRDLGVGVPHGLLVQPGRLPHGFLGLLHGALVAFGVALELSPRFGHGFVMAQLPHLDSI